MLTSLHDPMPGQPKRWAKMPIGSLTMDENFSRSRQRFAEWFRRAAHCTTTDFNADFLDVFPEMNAWEELRLLPILAQHERRAPVNDATTWPD